MVEGAELESHSLEWYVYCTMERHVYDTGPKRRKYTPALAYSMAVMTDDGSFLLLASDAITNFVLFALLGPAYMHVGEDRTRADGVTALGEC